MTISSDNGGFNQNFARKEPNPSKDAPFKIEDHRPSEIGNGNPTTRTDKPGVGPGAATSQALPAGGDTTSLSKEATALVDDIVGEFKAKLSPREAAKADRLLTQAAIALKGDRVDDLEADRFLTQATKALLGDPDADENSEEFKKIKAALPGVMRKLVSPRVLIVENGDLANDKAADLLKEGTSGGYDPKSNTILLSRALVAGEDAALKKDTGREEVAEVVVEELSRKTDISFTGDAGDRLSSVFSGKSAQEAIADEAPGPVTEMARLA